MRVLYGLKWSLISSIIEGVSGHYEESISENVFKHPKVGSLGKTMKIFFEFSKLVHEKPAELSFNLQATAG